MDVINVRKIFFKNINVFLIKIYNINIKKTVNIFLNVCKSE